MKHFVITVGREFGSGGSDIAKLLAARLGVRCYDRTLIDMAVEKTGFVKDCLVKEDESMTLLRKSLLSMNSSGSNLIADDLMQAECEIINNLAEQESCVIVGRCADYVLEDRDDVFSIFICAPEKARIARTMVKDQLSEKEAGRLVRRKSSQRAGYYKYVTGDESGNNKRVQLKIDSTAFGSDDGVAAVIEAAVRVKFAE